MMKFIMLAVAAASIALLLYAMENTAVTDKIKNTNETTTVAVNEANVNITETQKTSENANTPEKSGLSEMRGVWLSFTEIGALVKGKTEKEYREALELVFTNLKKIKINTVFYQARAFCDAFYRSEIFPVSEYIGGEKIEYDPLEIIIEIAKKYRVCVHAWVNPFRVSYSNDTDELKSNSPALSLLKKDDTSVFVCDKGIFLNPSDENVKRLVADGIRELLENYEIGGIHFDDYFYPECDFDDSKAFGLYKKQGGKLTVEEWRRENVSSLVGSIYTFTKNMSEDLIFSISPSGDIDKCINVFYADVKKWCNEEGYADFIIPQLYYGFENEKLPFKETADDWNNLAKDSSVTLVCGLAPYKCGERDKNAGSGAEEWKENTKILSRQYEYITEALKWKGFALFSYTYCFGENINGNSKKEIKSLGNMLK